MVLSDIDKAALLEAIVAELTRDVQAVTGRARDAAAGAVHEEARAEDSKDTRATEQSYLARGLAARVADLELDRAALRALRPRSFTDGQSIAATALVELESDDGEVRTLLLVPAGGGRTLRFAGREITLATPASPLGAALLEASEGDEVEVVIKGRRRTWEIVAAA
jgi:transcription elongation GreA/GreB family factor